MVRRSAKTKKNNSEINEMFEVLLKERSMTHQELFGKFIEAFQWVDQQIRYCIRDKNMKYNYQNNNENFGEALKKFKKYYPNHNIIEWLEDLGRFRGDRAHNYFKDLYLNSLKFGESWKRVEHRSLQKAIRAAEHCMIELNNLRYINQAECKHVVNNIKVCQKCGFSK